LKGKVYIQRLRFSFPADSFLIFVSKAHPIFISLRSPLIFKLFSLVNFFINPIFLLENNPKRPISFYFILFTWSVRISLRASLLIPTSSEVNDQVNLQWPSILATTRLKPEITWRTNPLIQALISRLHIVWLKRPNS